MATEQEIADRALAEGQRQAQQDSNAQQQSSNPANAANAGSQGGKPEKINEEKGYETLVRQMQYYLLYILPPVLVNANKQGHLQIDTSKTRLRKLDVDDTSGNLSVSSALSRTTNIPAMRKIPPNVLAGLQPMIRVYKVVYPDGFKKGGEVSYQVPFDDNVRPLSMDAERIEDILSARAGGLDIASLVSFDYQFIGTNPAESETSITAKMRLKFLSISSLLDTRKLVPFSVKKGEKFKHINFKYADLVNQSLRESPDYYRIKIHVGYKKVTKKYIDNLLSKGDNIQTFSKEYVETLVRAINESNMFLYLYPVAHDLNFNEGGTIDLNIEFRGAIERSLTGDTSNVLLVGDDAGNVYREVKRLEEKIAKENSDLEKSRTDLKLTDEAYNKKRQDLDEKLKLDLKKAKAAKARIYTGFIRYLYKTNRIRSVNFIPEAFGASSGKGFSSATVTDNSILRSAAATQFVVPKGTDINYSVTSDPTEVEKLVQMLINQVEAAGRETSTGDAASGAGKSPGSSGYPSTLPTKINFIFFQDLITSIFEHNEIKQWLEIDDFYMILGNILIPTAYNYVETFISKTHQGLFLSQLASNVRGIGEVPLVQYNIGNLPISVELFNKWLIEHVVKPGKVDWKLKHFLYDVMELIRISTLSIFGNQIAGLPATRTLINATTVSKELGQYIKNSKTGEVSFIDKVPKNLASFDSSQKTADPRELSNVLFLYVPAIQAERINVLDPPRMEREFNMFTFTVGSNVGLMKKVSYKKMEIPGIREARATQEGELATGTFRMKYDADIEMYGPCYFRPGDMVIINPVFFSKKDAETDMIRLAKDLGLGGVYMVLRTSTDISRDGMLTKLETVFQSYGNLFKKNLIRPADNDLIDLVAKDMTAVEEVARMIVAENHNDITTKEAQAEYEKLFMRGALGLGEDPIDVKDIE